MLAVLDRPTEMIVFIQKQEKCEDNLLLMWHQKNHAVRFSSFSSNESEEPRLKLKWCYAIVLTTKSGQRYFNQPFSNTLCISYKSATQEVGHSEFSRSVKIEMPTNISPLISSWKFKYSRHKNISFFNDQCGFGGPRTSRWSVSPLNLLNMLYLFSYFCLFVFFCFLEIKVI